MECDHQAAIMTLLVMDIKYYIILYLSPAYVYLYNAGTTGFGVQGQGVSGTMTGIKIVNRISAKTCTAALEQN